MKKIFSFGKRKKRGLSPNTSDTGSVLSVGYELKDKDLGKLHRAAFSGDVTKIRQLLKKHDINQLDKENRTPLHLACANGHLDAVTLLVESKCKLNLCDNDNRSPLMKSIQCQQEQCAAALLEHDADPNLVDINGNSALHLAALIPSISIAIQLLEHGADINAVNKERCTPLILAVNENNQEMVEFLLKEGADVNSSDINSRTSLMISASNGQISLVRMLLQHDADISIKDDKGWTADDHAVMNGHHACSHLIIEHGSKKKPNGSPAYYGANKKRNTSVFTSPDRVVEGRFALGSPATDKEATDDFSQAESESRVSRKSEDADSWPSSDGDDFDFSPQKTSKPSLTQLLHKKKKVNEQASITTTQPLSFALQCQSDSDEDSLHDSQDEDENNQPHPKPFPPNHSFPFPVPFTPGSFTKPPQMTSTPFLGLTKMPKSSSQEKNADLLSQVKNEEQNQDSENEGNEENEEDNGSEEEECEDEEEECEDEEDECEDDEECEEDDECDQEEDDDESEDEAEGSVIEKDEECLEEESVCENEEHNSESSAENNQNVTVNASNCVDNVVFDNQEQNISSHVSSVHQGDMNGRQNNNFSDKLPEEDSVYPIQDKAIPDPNDIPVSLIIGVYENTDENVTSYIESEVTSLTSGLKSFDQIHSYQHIIKEILQDDEHHKDLELDSEPNKRGICDKEEEESQNINRLNAELGQIVSNEKTDNTEGLHGTDTQISKDHEESSNDEIDGSDNSEDEEDDESRPVVADIPSPGSTGHYHSEEKQPVVESPVGRKALRGITNIIDHCIPAVALMSELGLEDDDVESPWDSESASDSPRKQSARDLAQPAHQSHMQFISEESNEEFSEKSTAVDLNKPQMVHEVLHIKNVPSNFSSVKANEGKVKPDIMADLGLDDANDLEDASDWDSSSHSLKYVTPNQRTASHPAHKLSEGKPPQNDSETASPVVNNITPATPLHPVPELEDEDYMQSSEKEGTLHSSTSALQQPEDSNNDSSIKNVINKEDSNTEHEHMLKASNLSIIPELGDHVDNAVDAQQHTEHQALIKNEENNQESSSDSELPWEDRYEKMWVDSEKKDVKTNFKNITAELKQKFGEISERRKKACKSFKLQTSEMSTTDVENPQLLSNTITDTKQSEIAVACEKFQTVIKPTLSSSENPYTLKDGSLKCGDSSRWHNDSGKYNSPNLVCLEEKGYPISKPINLDQKCDVGSLQTQTSLRDSLSTPTNDLGKNMLYNISSKPTVKSGPLVSSLNGIQMCEELGKLQQNTTDNNQEQQNQLQSSSVLRFSCPEASKKLLDKELEQDMKRFKNEVGMLQMVFLNMAKEREQLQKEKTTLNGDPLDVFDDSTLSETSQEEDGRVTRKHSNEKHKMDNSDDLDDFTQSSDTATEDYESPTSTYRNAMLLLEQLGAEGQDPLNLIKIQNIINEYERVIQRDNGRYGLIARKVKKLENERKEFQQTTEKNRELKSMLDHQKVEWESDLNNLRFTLKQEEEKRKSAEMLYDKSRDQLRKKEDQCCKEMEEKQQLELTLRNLELELRSLRNSMKQVEEERNEAQRMLSQERSARVLQEGVLNNLRRKTEIEENEKMMAKSAEVLNQASEIGEREKDLIQRNVTLQEEIATLKLELEQVRTHKQDEESRYMDENEILKEKIDDLRRDLKMNEETLTQTVIQYNGQLNALKTEAAMLCSNLDREKQSKERLETEMESIRSRLTSTLQELERNQTSKVDADRTLQREREEWLRSQDKLNHDLSNMRENNNNLSQQLSRAETKSNNLEYELHRTVLSLQEKTLLSESTQRELTQAQCRIKELERTLQLENDQINKSSVKQESLQERLQQMQSENMLLRQQLEDVQNKGLLKEKAVSDVQDRFTDIFSKLRADTDRQIHIVEERNKDLINKSNELREQIYKLETEKVERESTLRQLQQELADALKKLAMSEASLEVITRYRNSLEEEAQNLRQESEKLKIKLQDLEDKFIQSERHSHQLKNLLEEKEREAIAESQKVQEFSTVRAEADKAIKQLEEHVQKLEIENAKIEATVKQQAGQIDILQKELQESVSIRNRLEDLIATLQSSKINLEDKLNQQVHKQSALSQNAQDSHNLWEEELKSRSRLGIRLAELDREKTDLTDQVESERKKVKKLVELKRSVEARFDQEMKRNNELQREVTGLKKLLKTTKKKLKEFESGHLQQSGFQDGSKSKQSETQSEVIKLKEKIEELSFNLERESKKYMNLESTNKDLHEQLSSMKMLHKNHERQEKGKRQLEDEVAELKRHIESNKMDQSLMEKYKREVEERGRQELRQKLEEVNLFLQSQAASQETLEQIRAANDASVRNQLEQRIKDLESELNKMKNAQQDNVCQKESTQTELDRFKDMYTEELKIRKALAAKLDRANERLAEANAKLLNERQRSKSLIASSIVNGSMAINPALDVSQLGNLGSNVSLDRSFGLGGSFLNSTANGLTTNRMESYLAKMRQELEKNIIKELDHANAELETGSARVSPLGSTAGSLRNLNSDQDPVTRATQQYLEVLKKNYNI
ncbi:ankyrin repeat domain-containing protein 26 [Rhinophrynus dorsalis]